MVQNRFSSTDASTSSSSPSSAVTARFANPPRRVTQDISEPQIDSIFPALAVKRMPDEDDAAFEMRLQSYCEKPTPAESGLPVLNNVYAAEGDEGSYRVTWFDYTLPPSLTFLYWAHRRLRELPPDWRNHYRVYLRQEMKAQLFTNSTWDMFIAVVEGYRKGKWILRKFDVPVDESLIPHPYGNFWEVTTPEERVWAYRRATKMKEEQGLQRALSQQDGEIIDPDDDAEDSYVAGYETGSKNALGHIPLTYSPSMPVQSGLVRDFREFHSGVGDKANLNQRTPAPTTTHGEDLTAPSESDIATRSSTDGGFSFADNSFTMGTIEDDKMWNPVLKNRLYQQRNKEDSDLYSFEDEDEFEDAD